MYVLGHQMLISYNSFMERFPVKIAGPQEFPGTNAGYHSPGPAQHPCRDMALQVRFRV
jgi:hypothetical protein